MKVRVTPHARSQLAELAAFISRDDPAAAMRTARKIHAALRRLARFPRSGRRLPEFPDVPHREVVVGSYRIFYRIEARTIWIVAIWHGAQVPDRPSR